MSQATDCAPQSMCIAASIQCNLYLSAWAKRNIYMGWGITVCASFHSSFNTDTNKTGKPGAKASPDLPDSSPFTRSTRGRAAIKLGSNGKFVYMIHVHVHVHVNFVYYVLCK